MFSAFPVPKILSARGLREPDRRPLYAYRVRDEEPLELLALFMTDTWGVSDILDPQRERAFGLFAAEWWRRNHENSPSVREEAWIRAHGVRLGVLGAPAVNDREFDACAGVLALLRVTLEKEALDSVGDDPISEGGILGLDSSLNQRGVVSQLPTGKYARGH